jgi:hypothetical protein
MGHRQRVPAGLVASVHREPAATPVGRRAGYDHASGDRSGGWRATAQAARLAARALPAAMHALSSASPPCVGLLRRLSCLSVSSSLTTPRTHARFRELGDR